MIANDCANASNRTPTVAVPRVLWWFRHWPFWKTFFQTLGCRVVTNDPGRPTPHRHDRASTIVEEACFPMQLLLDRTLALADQADFLFMPRLISVSPRGIMCPRFAGAPDIVRMVLEQGGTGCRPDLLTPILDARPGRWAVRDAWLAMAVTRLGAADSVARRAFAEALAVQERFEADFEIRLNTLPTPDVFELDKPTPVTFSGPKIESPKSKTGLPRLALLGHPYLALDWEFNLGLIERLRGLGFWILPVESVAIKHIESSVKQLDKSIYWSSGREIIGSALHFFKNGGAEGLIYLSCFKCGVDGLLNEVVRWAARHQASVPYLALTLDGHDNEVGLATRLEAFVDIVNRRSCRPVDFS